MTANIKTVGRFRVGRATLEYAVGSIVGKASGVLLLPILARALGPADYGIFDVVSTTGSALTIVLLLGLDAAATRVATDPRTSDPSAVFSTWLAISLGVGVGAAALIVVIAEPASLVLTGSTLHADTFRLLAVIAPVGILNFVSLTALRVAGRSGAYASLVAGSLLLNAILAAVAVGLFRWGLHAAIGAWLVALTVAAIIGLRVAGIGLRRPNRSISRVLFSFGLPLVPAAIAVWGADVANRAILWNAAGIEAVGLLSVALRLASLVGLVGLATQLAWVPATYLMSGTAGVDDQALRPAVRSMGAMMALAVAATVAALPAASLVAGPEFAGSWVAVGPLVVGGVAAGSIPLIGIASAIAYRSGDIAVATTVGAAAGLALNMLLAPPLGLTGTAMAVGASQVLSLILMATLARRHASICFPAWRLGGAATLMLLAVGTVYTGSGDVNPVVLATSISAVAAIVGLTWTY